MPFSLMLVGLPFGLAKIIKVSSLAGADGVVEE